MKNDLQQALFLRGWINPPGSVDRSGIFNSPDPNTMPLHVSKSAYYPVSSLLHGGTVPSRVLVTSELERKGYVITSVEVQRRSSQTGTWRDYWVTETIHTPQQFAFKLASDPMLPGLQSLEVRNFLNFVSRNGFDACMGSATSLGRITFRHQNTVSNRALIQLDSSAGGKTFIRVLQQADMEFMGGGLQPSVLADDTKWPPLPLESMADETKASEVLLAQIDSAKTGTVANTFAARIRRWFSPASS